MGVTFSQMWPPKPTLTEENLPSQAGKVFIVTGATSGIGYELTKILFFAGARVYLAVRSEANAKKTIEELKALAFKSPSISPGQLEYLLLELDDLTTIKPAAEAFKQKESRLDVLWNNAAVSLAPLGSKSKQGYELHVATNCLGPYLFTQLLLPILQSTAATSKPGSVRVIWSSSLYAETASPKGGIILEDLDSPPADQTRNYTNSKVGNWFLASELAGEVKDQGIISVAQNPGNLKTNLLRHTRRLFQFSVAPLLYKAKMGAYTELWAGLSEVTVDRNWGYIIPWGRLHPGPRQEILDALKTEEDGGTGQARKFREWCESKVAEYR